MTEQRDRGLHRHGDPDPSKWEEAPAVTGRPADQPPGNSTLASRAKGDKPPPREEPGENSTLASRAKQVDKADVEDKAVKKAPAKRAAAKKATAKG